MAPTDQQQSTATAAHDVLVLSTTVGSEADAARLARAWVEARLAACVQVERITSTYRWQGAVCTEDEWRLVAKTAPARRDALLAAARAGHPYQLPQLTWHVESASADYAAWVVAESAP